MTARRASGTVRNTRMSATDQIGSVVKLRQQVAPAVTSRPGRTPRRLPVMQPDDTACVRNCAECGQEITDKRRKLYCRPSCQRSRTLRVWPSAPRTIVPGRPEPERFRDLPPIDGDEPVVRQMSTGTKGAISEYLAVVDLLRRGCHVFRAVSPACPWDLVVALPSGKLVKVEVKSAVFDRGRLYMPPFSNTEHDVAALVTPEDVIYDPPFDTWEAL